MLSVEEAQALSSLFPSLVPEAQVLPRFWGIL